MLFRFLVMTIFVSFSSSSLAQLLADSSNYYDSARGLDGYELKSELRRIISRSHRDQGYKRLFNIYIESDADFSYDGDGSIVDIYSENPHGEDPYNFSARDKCGNYSGEADCFNREHIFPQGVFGKRAPMKSDFFHVFPTDGYVNNRRGSLPFGEVGAATWISENGSKVGFNTFGRYSGKVFEPIDEFKGDVARALLYFATRYENQVSSWRHEMLDGSNDQVYRTWFIRLLVSWNKLDPVSEHEYQRNEAGYRFQGNRNPFIDHPEWVDKIWQ